MEAPPKEEPLIRIQPPRGWSALDIGDLWRFRDLLLIFVWRDVKVRYKQAAIGGAWAILQPVASMAVFTVFFGRLARVPSDGIPYPIFAFAALLPWNLFANGLARISGSIVSNSQLISKVYFPRLVIPVASAVYGTIDFAIALVVLFGMMAWFGITPHLGILTLPLFFLLDLVVVLAAGLWLAGLNVKYRDVTHAVPLLLQLWMFTSPVIYSVSLVPERWRLLYYLNPMVGVIEGFRWALFGKPVPHFSLMALETGLVIVVLLAGIAHFRRMEREFADVI
jgi:lipopolysaccharide transport system permease protein